MARLSVFVFAVLLTSCASFQGTRSDESSSPGYQYGRQLDERAMRSGFLER